MPHRTGDKDQVITVETRIIPRAYISALDGSITYPLNIGSRTFRDIYNELELGVRQMVAETPFGVFATDLWEARLVAGKPTVGPVTWFEDLDQAIMATVLTASNQPDRMSMVTSWKVTYAVTIIDERKLQCRISPKPA